MKIALLTYYYPPSSEVGALRAARVAQSFLSRGYAVHVITPPPQGYSFPPERSGETLHHVPAAPGLRDTYRRLRRCDIPAQVASSLATGNDTWKPPERISFLKRHISSLMWLPDDKQSWIRAAANHAAQLSRDGRTIIYSTAPPFSAHLAAFLVKRRTGAAWIAEFRDPWTDNPGKPPFVRSAWSDAIERWLERRCLTAADVVVAVTDSVGARFRARLPPERRERVIVVRNGIGELDHPARLQRQVRRIVYLGSLYQKRDPRPFLTALGQLQQSGRLPQGFCVDFIGDCRWYHGIFIEDFVRSAGLTGVVRFFDPLPHAEAIQQIRAADMLLLFAQHQPLQVPNKLYEYLGVRRPVLAFADPDGETASLLRRLGGHFVIDTPDPDLIAAAVSRAIDGHLPPPAADGESMLRQLTAASQFDLLHEGVRRFIPGV